MMVDTAKPYMQVPMSCDPYVVKNWYSEEMTALLLKTYSDLIKSGLSEDEAIKKICEEHTELLPENIVKALETGEAVEA